jgi:RNA polymerase sigma-70 factor (ECF subfamily)
MRGPGDASAPGSGAAPEVEALLRGGHDAGRAAHPGIDLPHEAFARRATDLAQRRLRRIGPALAAAGYAAALAEALSRAALADLFLAVACEEGVPGAWDAFAARYGPVVAALALRRGASRQEAEDLSREIPGDLFAPPPGGGARTRLGTYDGTGSLTAWLGVLVHRRLVDQRRAAALGPAPVDPERAEAVAAGSSGADPAAAALDAETARRFGEALRDVWGSLSPRETLAVLLRYRDGLPQTDIARLLAVGEPRVSRILAGAAEKIRAAVQRRVGARPAVGSEDPDRLRAALQEALVKSMASLAAPSDPSTDG